MDNAHHNSEATPGYETRDANARGVYGFLIVLAIVIVIAGAICWGMFAYFSHEQQAAQSDSAFTDTRQLPAGPQLQVNPRQEWLSYRQRQDQSLESYGWENRTAGTVRVPIELAMQLLLQKGLPVQSAGTPNASGAHGASQSAPATNVPTSAASPAGKKQ